MQSGRRRVDSCRLNEISTAAVLFAALAVLYEAYTICHHTSEESDTSDDGDTVSTCSSREGKTEKNDQESHHDPADSA